MTPLRPIACIGECMIELRERPDGRMDRAWGGDTLNTAVYLARLGLPVEYVTALGDDGWSDEMVAAWALEGVGTTLVQRLPGRLPGLYVIQTDPAGERRFLYWRDSAAARRLFDHLDPAALDRFGLLYLSGITLSIFDARARATLLRCLEAARRQGAQIVFDTNFRPRGWPDRAEAQQAYNALFALAHLVLASVEDLGLLYGTPEPPALLPTALMDHAATTEIVLKLDTPACRLFHGGRQDLVQAAAVDRVVDTTAAGDSFAAAYLAARLRGATPPEAARAGHALAAAVIRHPGAIIPLAAMQHHPEAPP